MSVLRRRPDPRRDYAGWAALFSRYADRYLNIALGLFGVAGIGSVLWAVQSAVGAADRLGMYITAGAGAAGTTALLGGIRRTTIGSTLVAKDARVSTFAADDPEYARLAALPRTLAYNPPWWGWLLLGAAAVLAIYARHSGSPALEGGTILLLLAAVAIVRWRGTTPVPRPDSTRAPLDAVADAPCDQPEP